MQTPRSMGTFCVAGFGISASLSTFRTLLTSSVCILIAPRTVRYLGASPAE